MGKDRNVMAQIFTRIPTFLNQYFEEHEKACWKMVDNNLTAL